MILNNPCMSLPPDDVIMVAWHKMTLTWEVYITPGAMSCHGQLNQQPITMEIIMMISICIGAVWGSLCALNIFHISHDYVTKCVYFDLWSITLDRYSGVLIWATLDQTTIKDHFNRHLPVFGGTGYISWGYVHYIYIRL